MATLKELDPENENISSEEDEFTDGTYKVTPDDLQIFIDDEREELDLVGQSKQKGKKVMHIN